MDPVAAVEQDEEQDVRMNEDVATAAAAAIAGTGNFVIVISKDHEENQQQQSENSSRTALVYQPRTFRPGSINSQRRAALLPAYPLAKSDNQRRVLLLLSNVHNVDRNEYEKESFCGGNEVCPFEFKQYGFVEPIDSFMIDLYRDLFIEPSRQWKISYSLIDYNLSRLRKSMELYTKQTMDSPISSLNELTSALEFFLQIDVDMFFMKTCNFRGAHPRSFRRHREGSSGSDGGGGGGGGGGGKNASDKIEEGILCEAKPIARYGMSPCYGKDCTLCQSLRRQSGELLPGVGGVHFSSNQVHRFVNNYEAILNCPANCNTSNVIYALTCPCDQYDYINSTPSSFHDRILSKYTEGECESAGAAGGGGEHRDENNRIIREFLIGINNSEHIFKETSRSAAWTSMDNEVRLYQHSPRCALVLQLFLDNNPEYWCLVPMVSDDARMDDRTHPSTSSAAVAASSAADAIYNAAVAPAYYQPESPTFVTKPQFFEQVLRNTTRSTEECIWLAKGLPKPPSGYRFSRRQIDEQLDFFKFKKEARILSSNLIDCYKYTIIAVLPDECSHELRRFIETLFITHAETKLNIIGRLTHQGAWPSSLATTFDHSNRGAWCHKLVRPSRSTGR